MRRSDRQLYNGSLDPTTPVLEVGQFPPHGLVGAQVDGSFAVTLATTLDEAGTNSIFTDGNGDLEVGGTLALDNAFLGGSGTPTFTVGSGAGGTHSSCTGQGTDLSGQVTIVAGTSPLTTAVLCTITFASASYPTGAYPVLQLANAVACPGTCSAAEFQALVVSVTLTYVQSTGGAGFTINAGQVGLLPGATYIWNYQVSGN
jgi:hypothetical protein